MRILLVCLLIFMLGVSTSAQNDSSGDNAELAQMYKEDQADRTAGTQLDWGKISERDHQREKRVKEMLGQGLVKTSDDYANAAMIFQHGEDTVASGMAVKMMRKAVELNPARNKWLLAAAIDRDLMRRNKPQIYGTQYRREGEGEWILYHMDEDAVTDAERREYDVPTLAQTYARLERMNAKQLMELYESGNTVDEVVAFVKDNHDKDSGYDLSEAAVNNFGYMLMGSGKYPEALKVFKLNVDLHPKAYNPWDSYGEVLLKLDRKREAREAYEKSLALNPENRNAQDVLKSLK